MSVELLELLERLRRLRHKAEAIASTVAEDHLPFQHADNPPFYFRLPSKPSKPADAVNITPTCTAWMALCAARAYSSQYKTQPVAKDAFSRLLKEPWDTGRLKQNNPFTVAVVARAVGIMVDCKHLDIAEVESQQRSHDDQEEDKTSIVDDWRKCKGKTLKSILQDFLRTPEQAIALEPFPASPTIGYWMIDAASKLRVELESEHAHSLATWAASEFRRQHSLVAAAHQAMMDPIALAMAACACKSLRRIAERSPVCYEALKACLFPSDGELAAGVREFFNKQNQQSGVWEKYFPIFHYPKSGPNHCWHFEVLEAVVSEFPDTVKDAAILERLNRSLDWLKINRLTFRHNDRQFYGWNAGGDIQAMRRGEPESWPTGVAHMFLARLIDRLSECIQATVLDKFEERVRVWPKDRDVDVDSPRGKKWMKLMDSEFSEFKSCGLVESRNSVKKMIEKEILECVENDIARHVLSPHFKITGRHSAVLFGPPGTSKTSLCEAIARRLGWHFVELSPSDFLGGGLEGIYNKVTELFEDLLDLYGVVILFDEMDALVQSRDPKEGQLDVTQTLLTTSMLPKLARLHKDRRALFFMATNYFGTFDGAITRSGRFDLLVHMGPPSTESKIAGLSEWCPKTETHEEIEEAKKTLASALTDKDDRERFGRFTYGETERFLYSLCLSQGTGSAAKALQKANPDEIRKQIREWAKAKIILCDNTEKEGALKDFKTEALKVCIQ